MMPSTSTTTDARHAQAQPYSQPVMQWLEANGFSVDPDNGNIWRTCPLDYTPTNPPLQLEDGAQREQES